MINSPTQIPTSDVTGTPSLTVRMVYTVQSQNNLGTWGGEWLLTLSSHPEKKEPVNPLYTGIDERWLRLFMRNVGSQFPDWIQPYVTISKTVGILSDSFGDEDEVAFSARNARRFFLIHKKNSVALRPEEEVELNRLQELTAAYLSSLPQSNRYDFSGFENLAAKLGVPLPSRQDVMK